MRPLAAFLLAVIATPLFGADTPEQVMKKYLNAVATGELQDVGQYFHPEEVAKFRKTTEPLIERAVRTRNGRQMFGAFIDPYEPKKLRSLSHGEFMSAILRWINTWQQDAISMFKQAEPTILGHVADTDVNHVIVRFNAEVNGNKWETVTIRSTRDYEGTQLLLVPGEITSTADRLRQFR